MRINKYIASCGLASRRRAEEYVLSKQVLVNGLVVTDLSYQVQDGDVVSVCGKNISLVEDKEYYLLNKPQGYLCTAHDDRGRKTIFDLMKNVKTRLFPVGRLDYNTQGMILLTNDGEFANYMMHPKNEMTKTYRIKTKHPLTEKQISMIEHGVDVGEFVTGHAAVTNVGQDDSGKYYTLITIHEGKNREIRRIFEKFGLQILELTRVKIGSYELGDLPIGKYKKLNKNDLDKIMKPMI